MTPNTELSDEQPAPGRELKDCTTCSYLGSPAPAATEADGDGGKGLPLGWLYDWTHSSALGKPDEHFTGFTTDEAHARKHDNPRPVYAAPPPNGKTEGDADGVAPSPEAQQAEYERMHSLAHAWAQECYFKGLGRPARVDETRGAFQKALRALIADGVDASRGGEHG